MADESSRVMPPPIMKCFPYARLLGESAAMLTVVSESSGEVVAEGEVDSSRLRFLPEAVRREEDDDDDKDDEDEGAVADHSAGAFDFF